MDCVHQGQTGFCLLQAGIPARTTGTTVSPVHPAGKPYGGQPVPGTSHVEEHSQMFTIIDMGDVDLVRLRLVQLARSHSRAHEHQHQERQRPNSAT